MSATIKWVEALDTRSLNIKVFTNGECEFKYGESLFKTLEGKHFIVTKVCFLLTTKKHLITGYKDVKEYFCKRGIENPTQSEVRKAIIHIRSQKFPDLSKVGNAGSFFSNSVLNAYELNQLQQKFPQIPIYPQSDGTVKISIAWILDHVLHLNGVREGDIGVYEHHSLVLVNYGGATTAELEAFTQKIIHDVKNVAGVSIVSEVSLIGNNY